MKTTIHIIKTTGITPAAFTPHYEAVRDSGSVDLVYLGAAPHKSDAPHDQYWLRIPRYPSTSYAREGVAQSLHPTSMNESTCKLKKPCKECPFARSVTPGELGGSPVQTYIGQAHGPFWLPCHSAPGYAGKQSDPNTAQQCAGAAAFRANIGRAHLMPPQLHTLPPDTDSTFANYAQFVAHHRGCSIEEAERIISTTPPELCMSAELGDPQAKLLLVQKRTVIDV